MRKHLSYRYLLLLVIFLGFFYSEKVHAGTCHNKDCGCANYGIKSCVGVDCWYTDTDGCTGHSWYLYSSTAATCTTGGSTVYKCSQCNGQRVSSSPALGHNFGGWSKEDGTNHKRSCSRCGLVQRDKHAWYQSSYTAPTCTAWGAYHYKCSVCSAKTSTAIAPLGHDFGPWTCANSLQHLRICRRCGLHQYENHTMTGWRDHGDGNHDRNCVVCGYSQTKGIFISVSETGWTSGNITVNVAGYDFGVGNNVFALYRVNCITGANELVGYYPHGGVGGWISNAYTQTAEGIYYYYVLSTDMGGHSIRAGTSAVYLDHSNPVIYGRENTYTEWTNVAPVISVSATDYLYGTATVGSGVRSVIIYADNGSVVGRGAATASYRLTPQYEGIHTWTIAATDNVGHVSYASVTTKYDITKPGIEGTEVTHVLPDGSTVSGYCEDNIISQHMDDESWRSSNHPNVTSGLKSVILYRVTGSSREVIYSNQTKADFPYSNTHSLFNMYYEIQRIEKSVSYYEIIVTDFAGNRTKKKLTSQYSLLSWFHTSINRSSYNSY